jgi:hypothetical protein
VRGEVKHEVSDKPTQAYPIEAHHEAGVRQAHSQASKVRKQVHTAPGFQQDLLPAIPGAGNREVSVSLICNIINIFPHFHPKTCSIEDIGLI